MQKRVVVLNTRPCGTLLPTLLPTLPPMQTPQLNPPLPHRHHLCATPARRRSILPPILPPVLLPTGPLPHQLLAQCRARVTEQRQTWRRRWKRARRGSRLCLMGRWLRVVWMVTHVFPSAHFLAFPPVCLFCLCACVCVCVRVRVYVRASVCVCVSVRVRVCIYIHRRTVLEQKTHKIYHANILSLSSIGRLGQPMVVRGPGS